MRRIAGILAFCLALAIPGAYFLVSYQYLAGTLDAQAELSAREATRTVMANPSMWVFEQVRLSELLERRPLTNDLQVRRILDIAGDLVAEHADAVAAPVIRRSHVLYDAGVAVGRVEVAQSLLPLLTRSAAVGALALAAAALLSAVINRFPRRAIADAERARAESEKRYRALFESMKEGVAIFRIPGEAGVSPAHLTLVDANPAWEALFGVRASQRAGADVRGLLATVFGGHEAEILRRAQSGEGFSFEAGAPDGERAFAVSVFYPEPGLFATLFDDQTEARRARAERERLQERIQQSQKLESLGVLAGGIAHDFNNLLVGILGNVDLALARCPPGEPLRPYLLRAETATQRAAELTNQMLAYSGKGRFVVAPVDLTALVGEMANLLATVVAKTAVLRYALAPGLPPVEADPTQLRQLAMNLITNASDALEGRAGVIAVSTSLVTVGPDQLAGMHFGDALSAGPCVCLEVSDTGSGMDPETGARIFDPFFTTKEKGRGLGLAAALGIVRGHHGALGVRSAPGAGTTFRVLFPALPAGAREGRGAAAPGASSRARLSSPGTVLVVDDEAAVRAVAREMLEEGGYRVLEAVDGVEGLEQFRRHLREIRAVLLDMTMPRMGGAEAAGRMHGIAPEVPVILCSGYTEEDTVTHLSGRAAAAFLQKPYRAQDLFAKLGEATGATPAAAGPGGA
jgi:signal transduction histidine kinase/CheY-like chemotaxis protein